MEQKRGEGKQRFLKKGGEQAGSRGGCLKKRGRWNPFTNYTLTAFAKKIHVRCLTGIHSNEVDPIISEAYSEPCQTSKMERFAKIVND